MRIPDLIVFVVYMAGITAFGISFYRKNKTSSSFILGNQAIPGWVLTMSFFATYVSSISFLALPGSAYHSNWNAFVFSLSIPFASFIAVKFFVPLYRKENNPSAYAYLEKRFGPWARIYASSCYILTQVMRTGTILYLLALPLHTLFGWNMVTIIVFTGLMVMVYSLLGGIRAVVWTDAIQGFMMIAGALFSLIYLFIRMPGGPKKIFEIALENDKLDLGSFSLNLSESTFWVVMVYGIFINLQNFGIDQNYVQRYMASRDERNARRSAGIGSLLYLPVSLIFFMIGTSLFSYYRALPDHLPAIYNSSGMNDRVFPYFIAHELPVGLTGILIASVFAAGMSTVSTSINSSSTIILTDYVQRFSDKFHTEKEKLWILYWSSAGISVAGILTALAMINVESALDTWWKLASVFSGGMLGLFLLGVFVKKANVKGTLIGVIIGLMVIFWMSLSSRLFDGTPLKVMVNPLHSYLTIVLGTLTIFLIGFLTCLKDIKRS